MGTLILSFVFGTIGFSYFLYGKKQRKTAPWLVGIGLCVFPYFVSNLYAGIAIGAVLSSVPWFFRGA